MLTIMQYRVIYASTQIYFRLEIFTIGNFHLLPPPSLSLPLLLPPSPSPLLLWLYVPPLPLAVVQSPRLLPPHSRRGTKSWGSFERSLSQREGRGPCPCTRSPRTWRPSPNAYRSWRRRACEVCSQDPTSGGKNSSNHRSIKNFLLLISNCTIL